jgi:WW domain-containing oxidoreductase
VPLDGIVANAGIANLGSLSIRHGVEQQFAVNHLGHFALVNDLASLLREGTGRVVVVSSSAAGARAAADGIMFDNLAGQRFYKPDVFYRHSKLANALYAKELSRRLGPRGIAVNTADPGAVRGTAIANHASLARRLARLAAWPLRRSPAQGAATVALLAASPNAAGVSGQYWRDCKMAPGNPLLDDADLGLRLWGLSEAIIAQQRGRPRRALARAA